MQSNMSRSRKHGTIFLIVCISLAFLSTCSTFESLLQLRRPQATIENVTITGLSFDQVELLFTLSVHNPNPVGIHLAGLDYRLSVENNQLIQSSMDKGIALEANASSPLSIPVAIEYVDLFRTVQSARGKDELGYQMDLDLGFSIPGYSTLSVPLTHTGSLPVPRIPSLKLRSLQVKKLGFSSIDIELQLEVENLNNFSIDLNNLNYDLTIAGHSWVEGKTVRSLSFDKKSKNIASIPLSLNIAELGRSVIELLSGSQSLHYELRGTTIIDTSLPLLKNYPFRFSSSGGTEVLH